MELQTLMIDYLGKTLGMTNDSLTAILFKKADDGTLTTEISENALQSLEELHATHIKTAGEDELTAKYDEGHKKGKFEALSAAEDTLRKKFNVEGKKLEDIVTAAVSNAAKAEGTEDKVLIHPLYLSLKADKEAEIEQLKTGYEAKISEVSTQAAKRERFTSSLPKIEQAMQEAGVVMPKNPAAAASIKKAFMAQFDAFDFDATDTGIYLKDASGKLLKDAHGHPVTLDSFTKSKAAEWFDIEKQPTREAPGNDPGNPAQPSKWTKDNLPKTTADFENAYYQITDPAERTAFTTAYQDAQTG